MYQIKKKKNPLKLLIRPSKLPAEEKKNRKTQNWNSKKAQKRKAKARRYLTDTSRIVQRKDHRKSPNPFNKRLLVWLTKKTLISELRKAKPQTYRTHRYITKIVMERRPLQIPNTFNKRHLFSEDKSKSSYLDEDCVVRWVFASNISATQPELDLRPRLPWLLLCEASQTRERERERERVSETKRARGFIYFRYFPKFIFFFLKFPSFFLSTD